MWIAAWVVGLGMLTLFFAEQEKGWMNPNQQPAVRTTASGAQEVMLQRNRQGHYVVSGNINGKPAAFLLDTGATDVVISANLARTYGLERGRRSIASTANGNVTVYATQIDQLSIGNIHLYQVPASINPGMDDMILLGMSALKQVELTQRGDTLTLRYYPGN
ncbi:MAG: retropepsin-like aspartic protease [Pseudomonadales bacterium]